MGNTCAGEREPVDASERRLEETRKASPDWAAAFKHMQDHSYSFGVNSKEQIQVQLGSSSDEVNRWAQQRVAKLSVLPAHTLESLWNKYDLNADGSLSLQELTVMLTDYLTLAKEEIPPAMLHSLHQHFLSLGMSETEVAFYFENPDVEATIDAMKHALADRFEHWLKNTEAFAQEIFRRMGASEEGNVSKHEFITKFPRACEKVLNLSDVKHIVRGLRVKEKHAHV